MHAGLNDEFSFDIINHGYGDQRIVIKESSNPLENFQPMIEFEKHDHISKNNPLYGEQLKMLEEVFYFRKERLELKNLTALS